MEAWSGIFDAENRRITRENFITGCTDNLDNTEGAEESCGAQFDQMERLCAFAVWNGSKGDRGGRKSISDWVDLRVE